MLIGLIVYQIPVWHRPTYGFARPTCDFVRPTCDFVPPICEFVLLDRVLIRLTVDRIGHRFPAAGQNFAAPSLKLTPEFAGFAA